MSAGKAARHQASISNSTDIFGPIGGLVSKIGVPTSARSYLEHAGNTKLVIPSDPILGRQYMVNNGLIQKNPASSGGVGRKCLMHFS
jgi:hypothetical protein